MLDLLQQCTDLRVFSLSAPSYVYFTSNYRLVTLPQLRDLTFVAADLRTPALIKGLVVPRLQRLIVDTRTRSFDVQDPELYSSLSFMINRSSCSLQSFASQYFHHYHDDLVKCLSLMLGLISLDLHVLGSTDWEADNAGCSFGTVILRLLTPDADRLATCLLPSLQRIAMHDYVDVSNEAILDFVHRRKQSIPAGIAPLTHVHVRRWEEIGDKRTPSPDLVALREDGLQITVETLTKLERKSFDSYKPRDGMSPPAWQ